MKLTMLTKEIYDMLYADIKEFRTIFNLPVEADIEGVIPESSDLLHTSLAIEELTEISMARTKEDEIDGLGDLIYVLQGRSVEQGWSFADADPAILYLIELVLHVAKNRNFDFIKAWKLIHASNLSKVADTPEQAQESVCSYKTKGVKAAYRLVSGKYVIYCEEQSTDNSGKTIKAGKILKSLYYKEVDLSSVVLN